MGSRGIVGVAAARVALHAGSHLYCGTFGRLSHVCAFPFRARSAREILPALLFAQPNSRRSPPQQHVPTDLRFLRTTSRAYGDRFRPSARLHASTSWNAALPFQLSSAALQHGARLLWREPPRRYPNNTLHSYLQQSIYGGATPFDLFEIPLLWGGLTLVLQLPFSLSKD